MKYTKVTEIKNGRLDGDYDCGEFIATCAAKNHDYGCGEYSKHYFLSGFLPEYEGDIRGNWRITVEFEPSE